MLISLLLSIISQDVYIVDRVETIEYNHFFDGEGKHVFDQLDFWDSDPKIIAWRLKKNNSMVVKRNYLTEEYEVIWVDGETSRRVIAKTYKETWKQIDPELEDRVKHPKERRIELSSRPDYEAAKLKEIHEKFFGRSDSTDRLAKRRR